MAKRGRRQVVKAVTKLDRTLGLEAKIPKESYGPTGHRRKPHNKPIKVRPLLGVIK